MASVWQKFSCDARALNLAQTLSSGQAFRWQKISSNEWRGVLNGKVWTLKEHEECIVYKVHGPEGLDNSLKMNSTENSTEKNDHVLSDYFRLNFDLAKLYKRWSMRDAHFKQVALNISGFRLLRQDPVENLFSFICSSNNNIERISKMVEALCVKYGEKVAEIDGIVYHSFPAISRLAENNVEHELRELKFGYRAKFIHETAKVLLRKNKTDWLISLRRVSYHDAHAALCQLPGVGAKVADCVCLMSLDKMEAIPVDTHVWQISLRDYDIPALKKSKSLTDKAYKLIGDYFRQLFGEQAGWANSVLFSGDLKKFQKEAVQKLDKDKNSKALKRKLCGSKAKGKTKKRK